MSAPLTGPLCDYEARIISLLGPSESPQIDFLVDLLLRLDADSDDPITVYISARGGHLIDALKLVDTVGLLRSRVTAVAFGLVEGAALLLLAAAHQRLLFPSTLLSTAGLWDLPELHDQVRPGMGLHHHDIPGDLLRRRVQARLREALGERCFLLETETKPRLLTATEYLQLGLADAIVDGPSRSLRKFKTHVHEHHLSH